jgi:hypothetical protein
MAGFLAIRKWKGSGKTVGAQAATKALPKDDSLPE